MHLPLSDEKGCPKGIVHDISGAAVRYIALVSFRVKDSESGKRSVAHFYRSCEVWPRLELTKFLAPAPRPLRATASKSLFMGGDGKVILTAGLVRLYWVSGQRCFVQINIRNQTKKAITRVALTLLRNTVVFRPQPQLDTLSPGKAGYDQDPDACQTTTTTKVVAESIGERTTRRHASAKGWWTGVPPKHNVNFAPSIIIPASEAFIPRGRLLEVEYILRVSLSAGTLLSTDMQVSLPIRLLNFISLDPNIGLVLGSTLEVSGLSKDSQSLNAEVGSQISGLKRNRTEDTPATSRQSDDANGTDPEETPGNSSVVMSGNDNDSDLLAYLLPDDSSTLDTTDEALSYAVAFARKNHVYGENAPRFADLYYTCALDGDATPRRQIALQAESSSNECEQHILAEQDESNSCEVDSHNVAAREGGPAASSFTHRVEEKLRATYKSKPAHASGILSIDTASHPSTDDLLSKMANTTNSREPLAVCLLEKADSEYLKIKPSGASWKAWPRQIKDSGIRATIQYLMLKLTII